MKYILLSLSFVLLITILINQRVNHTQKKNSKINQLIEYDEYTFSLKELVRYCLLGYLIMFATTMVFYSSIYFSILISLLGFTYPKLIKNSLILKRKESFRNQFKEFLYIISSSISAGKSVEVAIKESLSELKTIFYSDESLIINEVKQLCKHIDLNEPLEAAFIDLAHRVNIDEVRSFSEVFSLVKRKGGNMVDVMKFTIDSISNSIMQKNEIKTMLSSKTYEQKVLSAIPLFIIIYLKSSSPEFMEPVFTTGFGRVMMTIALIIFLVSFIWSNRIMNIEVGK